MKPKPREFIPFFGMIAYFKRYFKQEKTGWIDCERALWMEVYHMVIMLIIGMPIAVWILNKIK